MTHYLVTGGAGFIGSHLVDALIKQGGKVTILDNLSNGKRENLNGAFSVSKQVRLIEGDVSDPKVSSEAIKGVDVVFHQAAVGSVPKSVSDPKGSHQANATGTLELLIAAKEARVKKFVNAASSSAYGDTPELPKRENMPANPFSPYAATKLAQEQYCRAFAVSYGMETISLRYFNVYGPRQDPNSQYAAVVPKFFCAYLKGEPPIIFGDGEQTRDFTYVGDVVAANLKASRMNGAQGEVFNIAGGKKISINGLAKMIQDLVGKAVQPKYVEARPGDIKHSIADISLAKERLGWQPTVLLEQGLRECLVWYQENL